MARLMTEERVRLEAEKIVNQLSDEDVAYATDPERGEYRDFAALHDLFDANELLPSDGRPEIEQIDDWNAIMAVVDDILLG